MLFTQQRIIIPFHLLLYIVWVLKVASQYQNSVDEPSTCYPWCDNDGDRSGWESFIEDKFEERQDYLIDSIKNNLNFKVYPETFTNANNITSRGTHLDQEKELKNSASQVYVVDFQHMLRNKVIDKGAFLQNLVKTELYNPAALKKSLRGVCTFLSISYWSYEWCFEGHLIQYHMEPKNGKYVRNPLWSLGQFKHSNLVAQTNTQDQSRKNNLDKDKGNEDSFQMPDEIIEVVEHFDGGQFCDETKTPRKSVVHIQCCENTKYSNYIQAKDFFNPTYYTPTYGNQKQYKATLNEITETSLCVYKAVVCTPFLCRNPYLSR